MSTDQENTEELKQHMARVGDKAQRILCSLSFRAWALTLAEVRDQNLQLDDEHMIWNGRCCYVLLLWFILEAVVCYV